MYLKFFYFFLSGVILVFVFVSFNFMEVDFYQYEGEIFGVFIVIGMMGGFSVFIFECWYFVQFEMFDNDFVKIQVVIDIDVIFVVCDWKDFEYLVKKKKDYFYVCKFFKVMVMVNGVELQEDGSY